MDNLHTHVRSSLYAAHAPAEALRILSRLEFHYTPKHASWLNPAECELSALTKQCLNRLLPDRLTLGGETRAWNEEHNRERVRIHWRFSLENARIKLKHLYPRDTIIMGTTH